MKKKYFYIVILFLIFLFNNNIIAFPEIKSTNIILKKADNEFENKNYIEALNLYKELLNKEKNLNLKKQLKIKILKTLKALKKWDDLIIEFEKEISNEKNNINLADLYNLGGYIYLEIDHEGYKIDEKIYRDKSHREGEYVYLYDEDIKKSYEYFLKAKEIYQKEKESIEINEKIININFELVNNLKSNIYPIFEIRLKNKEISDKEKIIFLLDEIIELNKLVKKDFYSAKALFEKGIYIFQSSRNEENKKYNEAIEILLEVINKYPKDKLAEESLYSIGEIYLIYEQIEKAIETFNKLINNYPKSIRVSDCKAQLQQIYKKELSISSIGVQLPNTMSKINVNFKNIDNVNFQIFEIDYENVINNSELFSNYNYEQKKINKIRKFYKKNIFTRDIKLSDKKEFINKNKSIDLKVLPQGIYIVEANKDNITAIAFLLVSNITIVKNIDSKKAIIRVVERESGKPIPNADIIVKQHYYDTNKTNLITKSKTDTNGLYIYNKQINQGYSSYINVIAIKDKNITFSDANYYLYYNKENIYKSFIYTDRPIYRPNHKVNFKSIIKFSENGELKNIPNQKVKVLVNNPKGEKIYEKELLTNKFGTINDSFLLNNNVPLGVYNIYTYINENQINTSQNTFRVEEYKKPEFFVKINSKDNDIYSGDKIIGNINANYYFGSPVINAKVHYKIVRSNFYYYPDFYYPFYNKIYPFPNEQNNQEIILKEGNLNTDNNGNAYLEFETEKTNIDYNYKILVDVTDSSRRNIKAGKNIIVTQKGFNAFINFEKGFYSIGERVNIEVLLKNPQGEPIINSGKLIIKKIENKKEEELISEELKANSYGKVIYKWKTEKEGQYKIIFQSYDKRKNLVSSERNLFIIGENFNSKVYKFQNLEIITDKENYNLGDTAKIMINSDLEDSYVMFFIETNNEIIENKLIKVKNKTSFLDLKIEKKHIPNFNIKVVMIRNNQLFIENKEISVNNLEQFINVDINTNNDKYLPNENGKIKVKTTDYKGKPLSSEISLSVIDKSLLYLQEDLNSSIKDFFYGDKRNFTNTIYSSLYPYLITIVEDNFNYENYRRNPSPLDFYYNQRRYKSSRVLESSEMSYAPSVNKLKQDVKEFKDEVKSDKMIIPSVEIRSYFPDTALWLPEIVTNSKGLAEIDIKFPDSITTWIIKTNAIDIKNKVGDNQKEIITKKNIMVRLQAPRFFVERDEITLSAIVNNDFDFPQNINCEIELSNELELLDNKVIKSKILAKDQKRFDWKVKVKKEGKANIIIKAFGNNESDAVKNSFPVYIHGINKSIFSNSSMKNDKIKEISLFLPKERKINSEKIIINFSSSVLSVMIESIPYLINYPYGCIEQTTSRFIPLIIANKTIKDLGIDLKNQVYSNSEIQKMLKVGLERIYNFQNSDGGWGWWNGFSSDIYMTSYVIYSLLLAKENNYEVNNYIIEKGLNFLKKEFEENNNIYNKIYVAYILSIAKKIKESSLEYFFKDRDNLNNYGKALLSLSYSNLGNKEKAILICKNLKSFVREDKENASWDNQERFYWYWYNDNIETNAFILKAFLKSIPNDPIVPKIVNWIITKRKSNIWNSTKDTANILYTLNDFVKINDEINPDYTISVIYNNKLLKKIKVNKENMFNFDNKIVINNINEGKSNIIIKKEGKGTLYYSSVLEYFTFEEGIKGLGKGINIEREYFKLKDNKSKKEKLNENDVLKSGDIVEVKLTIKANNDYEYLIFEDMKPSGFEAIDLKSGYIYQNGIYFNREFRDEKVIFFIDYFKQGTQIITYKLRAEIPGKFHILPHNSYAMYSPEIKSISDEMNLGVVD